MRTVLTAITIIVLGLVLYRNPSIYGYPVSPLVGIIICVYGLIMLPYGILLEKRKRVEGKEKKYMICPKCEKTFLKDCTVNSSAEVCSDCHINLEPLDGYFERKARRAHEREEERAHE